MAPSTTSNGHDDACSLFGADNFQIDVNGDGVAVVTMDFKGMKVLYHKSLSTRQQDAACLRCSCVVLTCVRRR